MEFLLVQLTVDVVRQVTLLNLFDPVFDIVETNVLLSQLFFQLGILRDQLFENIMQLMEGTGGEMRLQLILGARP